VSASKWGRTEVASGRKAAARNRLTIQSARLQSRRRTAGNSRHRRGRQNSPDRDSKQAAEYDDQGYRQASAVLGFVLWGRRRATIDCQRKVAPGSPAWRLLSASKGAPPSAEGAPGAWY
jgi:hypothetical protein